MALKKNERKEALLEIYHILKGKSEPHSIEARKKILLMLCADGLYIIEKDA